MKSFEETYDVLSGPKMRRDANDVACALIRVYMPEDKGAFEGDVVGDVRYEAGEYLVYFSPTTAKKIRVKYAGCNPIIVTFADYGIERLRPNGVYVLQFDNSRLGSYGAQSQAKRGNFLRLSVARPMLCSWSTAKDRCLRATVP